MEERRAASGCVRVDVATTSGGERGRVPRRKGRDETPGVARASKNTVGIEEERQTWTTRKETHVERRRRKLTDRNTRRDRSEETQTTGAKST